jgi:hypothetical protein
MILQYCFATMLHRDPPDRDNTMEKTMNTAKSADKAAAKPSR